MKVIFLLLCLVLGNTFLYSQLGGAKWAINGNSVTGGLLGTTNFEPLNLISNNQIRFIVNANGDIVLPLLTSTGSGITILDYTGKVSRLNLTNSNDVLFGDGSFKNLALLTGWTTGGGVTYTNNKVGIGVSNPTNALEVVGSAIFSNSVSAQEFIVGDVTSQGKNLRISSSICLDGWNPTTGMRNELCVFSQPLYINSKTGYDFNTIANADNSGYFGIGTNSPTTKLHVNGSFRVDGETQLTGKLRVNRILPLAGDTVIHFGDSSVAWSLANRMYWTPYISGSSLVLGFGIGNGFVQAKGNNSLALGYASNCDAINSIVVGNFLTNTSGDSRFVIGTGVNSSQRLGNNAVDNSLVIGFKSNIPTFFVGPSSGVNTTGSVGIGTASVEDKFQIQTNQFFKLTVGDARFPNLHYGTSYIGFNANRTSAGTWKTQTDGQHNGGAVIYTNVIGNMYFTTIGDINETFGGVTGIVGDHTAISDDYIVDNTSLYIDGKTGNVGIGTICQPYLFPYKLAVNGKIICEEVKVKISDASGCWPDYVYASDYELMPLTEVEIFIDSTAHLPGFKSATEIEAEGISIAETVTLQQVKIEEIYLYLFEQDKINKAQQKEIEVLKLQNSEMRNELVKFQNKANGKRNRKK